MRKKETRRRATKRKVKIDNGFECPWLILSVFLLCPPLVVSMLSATVIVVIQIVVETVERNRRKIHTIFEYADTNTLDGR